LLVLEIYELCIEKNQPDNFIAEVYNSLLDISKRNPQYSKLIENGLKLVDNKSLLTAQ